MGVRRCALRGGDGGMVSTWMLPVMGSSFPPKQPCVASPEVP